MQKVNNLTQEDFELIKKFINMYETIEEQYKNDYMLCESLRKNMMFQKYAKEMQNSTIEEIFNRLKKEELKKIEDEDLYRKNLIMSQIDLLEQEVKQINNNKEIERLYNMIYIGNISEYFKEEEIEEEKPTKEYKKDIDIKEQRIEKKSTITQIYRRLKNLYDYKKIYDKIIDTEVLNDDFDFYEKFKEPIRIFLNANYNSIMKKLNITEPSEKTIEIINPTQQRTK